MQHLIHEYMNLSTHSIQDDKMSYVGSVRGTSLLGSSTTASRNLRRWGGRKGRYLERRATVLSNQNYWQSESLTPGICSGQEHADGQ
jgi:hypothetical protein